MGKRKSSYVTHIISPVLPTVYHRQWNIHVNDHS